MKTPFPPSRRLGHLLALVLSVTRPGVADEGMWLFNAPPRRLLQERYGFNVTDTWLEHVQKASVRFNSGGSGAFVSADGLVMSNHHVGSDALQKLGDSRHDYLRDGYSARTLAEEKPCLDMELNVLQSIEDVTDRVAAAVTDDAAPAAAFAARRARVAQIEKESADRTGLRSEVVTLYQGAQYHLYRYQTYTDVRLVFAPEQQIAFFGGDPANFEYPRFNLDVCFFRVYENGRPASTPHWLKWSPAGPTAQELVFVSGHPGTTGRLLTQAEIEFLRDHRLPFLLKRVKQLEVSFLTYGARDLEKQRQTQDDLYSVQNSRKSLDGQLAGLLDPALGQARAAAEAKLRDAKEGQGGPNDPELALERIARAQQIITEHATRHALLEEGAGFNSVLFHLARTLVRAAAERPKPNGDRLEEYADAGRESLELELFSPKPISIDYEIWKLADSLTFLVAELGFPHPLVQTVLAGQSPRQRAESLVKACTLIPVATRRQIHAGGQTALDATSDPMLQLARAVDPAARAARQATEVQQEIQRQGHTVLEKARLTTAGPGLYPDATFSLRLAFGIVKGYEQDGQSIPFQTTFGGLFELAARHQERPPYHLPDRWFQRQRKLNPQTPFNFVCTADIVGGNSGSPVLNRNAEIVGLIFDGNIQSLVLDYQYTEDQARAVAVHSVGLIEGLRKVYSANALVDELTRGRRPK